MEFVGKDGNPAPRLKDAGLSDRRLREAYIATIKMMRHMFHKCRLIHADLSEYNMLYWQGNVYIIDVSQSVEHDHPNALEFLRMDCRNVNDYFRKQKLVPMSVRELFNFITDPDLKDSDVDTELDRIMEVIASRPAESTNESLVDDAVFANAFIPRTLNEVLKPERDFDTTNKDARLYATMMGMEGKANQPKNNGNRNGNEHDDEFDDDENDDEDDDGEHEDGEEDGGEGRPGKRIEAMTTEEYKKFKKQQKKEMKEAKRTARMAKTPKHVKKRAQKQAKQSKK